MRCLVQDPADFRGQPIYRIQFDLEATAGGQVEGMIHRSYEEFKKFDDMLHSRWVFDDVSDVVLPAEDSVENIHEYLQVAAQHNSILISTELSDFLGINWSGSDLHFMSSLTEFMKVVIPTLYRSPEFPPEPPVFMNELDTITAPETPFEVYVYLEAFRAKGHINEYLEFFNNFLNTYPDFSGEDVSPAGHAVTLPPHFNQTFVHFLPGGYLNGHTVRISYLGKSKFNFLHEDLIREYILKYHGDKKPKRILDIGTGPGFSAFVLAELFPEAEVIAVDLAAPYIRMARQWQTIRNISNIQFYEANAEDMSFLESESFDLINYAYVLHEMPADNCKLVVDEMYRLLKSGGVMNGFEVPYVENAVERFFYIESNTWGHHWDDEGEKGPEPYIEEYELGAELSLYLESIGFVDVQQIDVFSF
jgi:SAM-dependent methyltransferase